MELISPKILFLLTLTISVAFSQDMDFSSPTYQKLSSDDKMTKLWNKIKENTTPYGWYSAFSIAGIFFESMNTTFDTVSDVFFNDREKLIHSVGTVQRVRFYAEPNSEYTGVFRGAKNVLLRLSAASEPDVSKRTAEGALKNFKPGFGLKVLRNGMESANLVGMYSLQGQESWNFFKNDMFSHATGAVDMNFMERYLFTHFSTASKFPTMVGMKEMASFDENGNAESKPNFPYQLVLRPKKDISERYTDYYSGSYLDQIAEIQSNVDLFDVLAVKSPGDTPTLIGRLTTIGRAISSEFGDRYLFFKHSRMDDDFKVHPEWQSKEILKDFSFQKSFFETYGFEHPH